MLWMEDMKMLISCFLGRGYGSLAESEGKSLDGSHAFPSACLGHVANVSVFDIKVRNNKNETISRKHGNARWKLDIYGLACRQLANEVCCVSNNITIETHNRHS